jgi:type I restriction enzyme, S subunit
VTWETRSLGELVGPVSRSGPAAADATFTYVDLSSVDSATKIINRASRVSAAEAPSRARQILRRADVLVATVRPNLNGVAWVDESLDNAIGSTGFTVLRSIPTALDSRFLFHWVRTPSFIEQMTRMASGANYPAVSDAIVKSSQIPIPSLREQRRIGGILDKVDELRSAAKRADQLPPEFEDARFLELFGNPLAVASRTLGEIVRFGSGGTPSKSNPRFWSGTIPWVSPKDMKSRNLYDAIDHVSQAAVNETSLRLFPEDTVAVVVRGMILAHSLPVARLRMPSTINQDMKALIPRDQVHPSFLATAIRSQTQSILQSVAVAGHGTRRLDLEVLNAVRIPNASIDEQTHFADTVSELSATSAALVRKSSELDALFASLQHRAFRGEL